MKYTILILVGICLGMFARISSVHGQQSIEYKVNGEDVDEEKLAHAVFCVDQGDAFSVTYHPSKDESDYAIGGLEMWAQLTMGRPKLIGQLGFSEPSKKPSMSFKLSDFNMKAQLPEGGDAVRVSIRIARIMKVDGRRLLEYVQLEENERTQPFMVVKHCE